MVETGSHAPGILLLDSATVIAPEYRDLVVVTGSHGGRYVGHVLAAGRVRGAVLNDAGVGKDAAGIGALPYLDDLGLPAVAVGHDSARIGDALDMARRGVVSHVNRAAAALGCAVGQACLAAARRLASAAPVDASPAPWTESRTRLAEGPSGVQVFALDSASLVRPEDAGHVVVTGSHGGLVGGLPETALRADAAAALFHDAGVGVDGAGISRLPVLDARGIPAAAVAADSARIGDGRSVYETGRLSHVNRAGGALGARPGMSAREFVDLAVRAAASARRQTR